MKRRDLIKLLEKNGWYLKRNGGTMIYIQMVTELSQFQDIQRLRSD